MNQESNKKRFMGLFDPKKQSPEEIAAIMRKREQEIKQAKSEDEINALERKYGQESLRNIEFAPPVKRRSALVNAFIGFFDMVVGVFRVLLALILFIAPIIALALVVSFILQERGNMATVILSTVLLALFSFKTKVGKEFFKKYWTVIDKILPRGYY